MLTYNLDSYSYIFGNIVKNNALFLSARCVSQCTGCICSCRCSCSVGFTSDFKW